MRRASGRVVEMRRASGAGDDTHRVHISKTISAILRRDATEVGLECDDEGWVLVSALLATDAMAGVDEATFLRVVDESNMQKLRYELTTKEGEQKIRATSKRTIGAAACTVVGIPAPSGPTGIPAPSGPTVTISVIGLDGGPICEAPVSSDATVMDAKKAICAASGILIQQQLLVVGSTVLTDASRRLLLDEADEPFELTCVCSDLNPKDACTWCCDVLGVPVESHCGCKSLYCVTCIRDMCGLNGEPAKFPNCPTCGTRLTARGLAASSVYRKRWDLIPHLDKKYGEVDCPRGCGTSYFRRHAREHMDICQRTVKNCRACGELHKDSALHQLHCPGVAFARFHRPAPAHFEALLRDIGRLNLRD